MLAIELSTLSLWVHTLTIARVLLLNRLAISLLAAHGLLMSILLLGILSLELVVWISWLLRLLHHWLTISRIILRLHLLLRLLFDVRTFWIIFHDNVSSSSLLNFLRLDDQIETLVDLMEFL